MAENTVIRARINERIKEEASAVLEAMGLTVSDAFRMLMVRVARDKALPFEPLVPNEKTIAAIKAARRGELGKAKSAGELIEKLNADDKIYEPVQARLSTRAVRPPRQSTRQIIG